jgi:hypothetical protein
MQKVPGVDKVHVSVQDVMTVLDLRPNNTVTLEVLRHVISNNGFVSQEVHVTAATLILGSAMLCSC